MSDLIYPCRIEGLAIYLQKDFDLNVGNEIPKDLLVTKTKILQWSDGDGYTAAFDQLCVVDKVASLLGHNAAEFGLAALIYGRWITIDASRLHNNL